VAQIDIERLAERLPESALVRAFRIAVSLLASQSDAEDAVQEALARACEAGRELRDPDAAEPWFLRVVTNQCMRILRRRRIRDRVLGLFGAAAPPDWVTDLGRADVNVHARPDLRRMLELLEQLPTQQRAALVLRYGHDMSVDEIARLLGVTRATAKTHLVRGLRALRERMERRR
jgi:RNA polymerase sigma-70 factor (ECF subfamily)